MHARFFYQNTMRRRSFKGLILTFRYKTTSEILNRLKIHSSGYVMILREFELSN